MQINSCPIYKKRLPRKVVVRAPPTIHWRNEVYLPDELWIEIMMFLHGSWKKIRFVCRRLRRLVDASFGLLHGTSFVSHGKRLCQRKLYDSLRVDGCQLDGWFVNLDSKHFGLWKSGFMSVYFVGIKVMLMGKIKTPVDGKWMAYGQVYGGGDYKVLIYHEGKIICWDYSGGKFYQIGHHKWKRKPMELYSMNQSFLALKPKLCTLCTVSDRIKKLYSIKVDKGYRFKANNFKRHEFGIYSANRIDIYGRSCGSIWSLECPNFSGIRFDPSGVFSIMTNNVLTMYSMNQRDALFSLRIPRLERMKQSMSNNVILAMTDVEMKYYDVRKLEEPLYSSLFYSGNNYHKIRWNLNHEHTNFPVFMIEGRNHAKKVFDLKNGSVLACSHRQSGVNQYISSSSTFKNKCNDWYFKNNVLLERRDHQVTTYNFNLPIGNYD